MSEEFQSTVASFSPDTSRLGLLLLSVRGVSWLCDCCSPRTPVGIPGVSPYDVTVTTLGDVTPGHDITSTAAW